MNKSVRKQIASTAISRLEQKQIGIKSILHTLVGYAEQPDRFLAIVMQFLRDFFVSLQKDDLGILYLAKGKIDYYDFKYLCRIALDNFLDLVFEQSLKDAVKSIYLRDAATRKKEFLIQEEKKDQQDKLDAIEKSQNILIDEPDEIQELLNKGKDKEQEADQENNALSAQEKRLENQFKSKIENGKQVKIDGEGEGWSNKIYESEKQLQKQQQGNEKQQQRHYIDVEVELNKQYAFQRGTKIENFYTRSSSSNTTTKNNESKEINLYRGTQMEIFKFQGIPHKVNDINRQNCVKKHSAIERG